MKYSMLFLLFFMLSASLYGQDAKYLNQVKTLDSTLETLYAVISGDKGEERNWELFKYLFSPGAYLMPTGKNENGVGYRRWSTDEYISMAGERLMQQGFYEKEISRKVEQFGHILHVWSTYASYYSEDDPEPFVRGINSIQLLYDGKRYWVMNILWLGESEEYPLPEKYLKK